MLEVQKIINEEMLKEAFKIRQKVFVEEQKVDPELEYDEFENSSHHYIALKDGTPVGTARWRNTEKGIKLERFAILKPFREQSAGRSLLKVILEEILAKKPDKIYLHAQSQVIPFYEKYGFEAKGPIFYEADISHRFMEFKAER